MTLDNACLAPSLPPSLPPRSAAKQSQTEKTTEDVELVEMRARRVSRCDLRGDGGAQTGPGIASGWDLRQDSLLYEVEIVRTYFLNPKNSWGERATDKECQSI